MNFAFQKCSSMVSLIALHWVKNDSPPCHFWWYWFFHSCEVLPWMGDGDMYWPWSNRLNVKQPEEAIRARGRLTRFCIYAFLAHLVQYINPERSRTKSPWIWSSCDYCEGMACSKHAEVLRLFGLFDSVNAQSSCVRTKQVEISGVFHWSWSSTHEYHPLWLDRAWLSIPILFTNLLGNSWEILISQSPYKYTSVALHFSCNCIFLKLQLHFYLSVTTITGHRTKTVFLGRKW
jgi:hypothetical protein